jgi:hypothetical protein
VLPQRRHDVEEQRRARLATPPRAAAPASPRGSELVREHVHQRDLVRRRIHQRGLIHQGGRSQTMRRWRRIRVSSPCLPIALVQIRSLRRP